MVLADSTSSDSALVQPLAGITVLEFGSYLAGPLVGLHLRHLGARVIAVVRPSSSRGGQDEAAWRPATVQALREGKDLVQLDLTNEQDKMTAWDMVQGMADVVIENFKPGVAASYGLDATACRARKPSLIHLSLPGFASTDVALAGFPAWEAVILATAGVFRDMGVNRQLMGVPASYSPLPLASSYGSVLGAVAVVSALLRQARVVAAAGDESYIEGDSIEIPLASALLDTLVHNSISFDCPKAYVSKRKRHLAEMAVPQKQSQNTVDYEDVQELMDPFYCHYRCADGRPFYLVAPAHLRHQMRTLQVLGLQQEVIAMGVPFATPYDASEPEKMTGLGAGQVGDRWAPVLRRMMRRAFLTRSAFEWENLLGAAGVPGAAHRSTTEWLESPHAREAGLVVEMEDGTVQPGPAAWVSEVFDDDALDEAPPQPRKVPELADLHSGPWLEGIKIVDLANVIAGPTIGATLARFGAEVVKVDAPTPTYAPEITVIYGLAANMGKQSILLDVKDGLEGSSDPAAPAVTGRAAFEALVADADVVVMNCTPACLERLRLTPQDLRKMNPHAVLARFDAWGGPTDGGHRAEHLGYDDNVQAALGIMERFGGGMGRVEEHAHVGTIDVVAGLGGALATVAALLYRERLGNDAAGSTIVARASLASLGQIVQFPYCCGDLQQLRTEASAASTRLGPDCRGEHSLLHCYEAGHGEWFLLAASLRPPTGLDDEHVVKLCGAHSSLSRAASQAQAALASNPSGGDFDKLLHDELVSAFKAGDCSGEDWVAALLRAGIASAVLHSLSDIRSQNLVEKMSLSGPTFQFTTDEDHPIGGPVTMFAQCAVRTTDATRVSTPSPAPRYGEQTDDILLALGADIAALEARGAIARSWTKDGSYLPAYTRDSEAQDAGPKPFKEKLVHTCPVCLEVDEPQMELSCGHFICLSCSRKSSQAGHAQCPLCRKPHLLDPEGLADRDHEYRRQYAAWRSGGLSGALGEVSAIAVPVAALGRRANSLPDLKRAAYEGPSLIQYAPPVTMPECWSRKSSQTSKAVGSGCQQSGGSRGVSNTTTRGVSTTTPHEEVDFAQIGAKLLETAATAGALMLPPTRRWSGLQALAATVPHHVD